MTRDLRAGLRSTVDRLRPVLAGVRAHRFWVEFALVAGLALGAAVSVGRSALARTEALDREAAQLQQVRLRMDRWLREAVRPSAQESLVWKSSEASLRTLNAEAAEPLFVAQLIARRAEEVGVADLRIRLARPDSVGDTAPVALEVGPWAVEPGGGGLVVEFTGSINDVVSFLGTLPPQVEVGSLSISPDQGRLRSRALLLLRRVVTRGGA